MTFDLASLGILGLTILGLVTLSNSLIFGTAKQRVVAATVLAVCVVSTMLVSASDFGHTQVVLDRPLDSLNLWSQLVVALVLAGSASFIWETLGAVRSIGTTVPPTVIAADEHPKLTTALTKVGETTPAGNLVAK